MPLVTSEKMLLDAQAGAYAIGAFNVENMEMAKAVIAAAEELKAPVMIQTTPSTIRYGSIETLAAMISAEARRAAVPVALHLDHGNSFDLAVSAMEEGYTSVMIDGSHEAFEDNIELTKKVVQAAKLKGIPVEAELGQVGGKEDDLEVEVDVNTNPSQAKEFTERTGAFSLAVAIGTAHGFYSGTPVLDKKRLEEIRSQVKVPLVLHGASGLKDEDIKDCIKLGICKVNFATELRLAYTDAIRALLQEDPDVYDPKSLGKAGMESVKNLVKDRMRICGCDNKATIK
ncbi:MAG: class II fructose-bisphosphate aldolase [Clostridiales bacterium]|nr:class II fructose-bisphosphate aldolase [Clostridiales bacterium]